MGKLRDIASRLTRRDESLAFQSAVLTAARAAGFAITFAIPIVLTRAFEMQYGVEGGRAEFGLYKLAFLIAVTCGRLLNIGLTASLYYFVPRDKGEGQPYIVQALLALSAIGVTAAALMMVFRDPLSVALNSPDLVELLPIVALMVLLMLPGDVVLSLPVIDRRPVLGAGLLAGSHMIRAGMLMGAAVVFRSVEAVVWAGVIAASTKVIALTLYVWIRGREEDSRPRMDFIGEQFHYALPFAVAVFFEAALASFHQFWVKGHVSDAVFAIYAAGSFQVPVIDMLVASVSEVVIVRAAAAWERHDLTELRRVWEGGMARLAVLIVPVWMVSEVLAGDVIGLVFGQGYLEAAPIFRIFLVALLLYMIIDHGILRATGDTRFLLKASAAGFFASAAALFVLARIDMMLGAVTSFVIGIAVMRLSGLWLVAKRLDISLTRAFPWRAFLSAMAAAGACAAGVWLVLLWVSGTFLEQFAGTSMYHFVRLALGGPLFLASYAALVWTFGLLDRDELRRIIGRFVPGRS